MNNMKIVNATLALMLLLPTLVSAQQLAPEVEPEFGAETRAWMDMQASNNAALGTARPMPGQVADKVFERYLQSFTHPIPEYFGREKFVEGGSSGGSQ